MNGFMVACGLMLLASVARAGKADAEKKAQEEVAGDLAVPEGEKELRLRVKETTTLLTAPGRYFGRASLQILDNGVWIMTYIHSDHHWACHDGQIGVMLSKDEGRTWLPRSVKKLNRPSSPVENGLSSLPERRISAEHHRLHSPEQWIGKRNQPGFVVQRRPSA